MAENDTSSICINSILEKAVEGLPDMGNKMLESENRTVDFCFVLNGMFRKFMQIFEI